MEQAVWWFRATVCFVCLSACVGVGSDTNSDSTGVNFDDADASIGFESSDQTPELTSQSMGGLASLFASEQIGRGMYYKRANSDGSWNPSGPAHIVTVELCAPGVRMRMTNPFDTANGANKLTVEEFGRNVGAAAVINGDWWLRDRDPGHPMATRVPRGLARGGGVPFADPPSSDFHGFGVLGVGPGKVMMKSEGRWLSEPEFAGFDPFNPASLTDMVSGQPTIVWNGQNTTQHNPGHCGVHRARSAVGVDATGSRIIMATVDERPGTSCSGLGDLMIRMGATRAQMQDSGGSAVMYVKGRGIVNRPSDGTPRRVVNHIGVIDDGSALPYSCAEAGGLRVTPLPPKRILDTRSGLGAPKALFDPWKKLRLRVWGRGGVPKGARTVLLNLTVTQPQGPGWMGVARDGTFSGTSNLNFAAGETRANLVWADIDSSGFVEFYGHAPTHLVADVLGYMGNGGSKLVPLRARRALDTRHGKRLAAGETRELQLHGKHGIPSDATAVLLNLATTESSDVGHLTVFDQGARPTTSNLNFRRGSTVSNATLVPIAKDGKIRVHAAVSSTELVVDVMGYTRPGAGMNYHSLQPTRVVDTRRGLGGHQGRVHGERSWTIGRGARAVVVNVTSVNPASSGFATLFAEGTARPNTSNLNYDPGQTVAGLAVVPVDSSGRMRLYSTAPADYVIDLVGVIR